MGLKIINSCSSYWGRRFKQLSWRLAIVPVLTLSLGTVFGQQRNVNGTVKSTDSKPLAGATIKNTKTGISTTSDSQGLFSIAVSPGDRLVISYVGYLGQEVLVENNSNIQIELPNDNTTLEDVVVVGYGTQKKATLTGAVSSVTNKEITITKNENVVNMLTGKLPGVRITQQTGQPGAFESNIDIRGMGEPLIVVDGIPRDKDYLSRMDANEIESVSVLKDASAAVYGVRSANGVLLVTTRRGASSDQGFEIGYSYNRGFQQFLYVPNTVGAADFRRLRNEELWRNFNNNYPNKLPATWDDASIKEYEDGTKQSSNFLDAAFDKTSPQQQHNLTVNGGSEKVNYFFNLGYMDQMGSYKSGSLNYNRYNFRSNVDVKITERLKASLDLGGYA